MLEESLERSLMNEEPSNISYVNFCDFIQFSYSLCEIYMFVYGKTGPPPPMTRKLSSTSCSS